MAKSSKVVYRKLGKERARGRALIGENIMEIDDRLRKKELMEILIHEKLHLLNPEWSETKVIRQSKSICTMLWEQNFRRVDL